jgi:Phosphotransferase enzyme family
MSLDPLIPVIGDLLQAPPERRTAITMEECRSGGNNRVHVVSVDGRKAVVKQYFRHPSDTRDRLHAERSFLEYAAKCAAGFVPGVIACDTEHGIGIYEYVEGTKLAPGTVSLEQVKQAAAFFLKLNDPANRVSANKLPDASEACFTAAEHFAMVDRRVARLGFISGTTDVDHRAREFVANLGVLWNGLKERLAMALASQGASTSTEVEERCVSPSDFGFHNALLRNTGRLCFVDFEYAGWDDPAKMIGDFFSHPAVPAPKAYFNEFVRETMAYSQHSKALETRARLLFPVFQVKWCCIILNDFIPEFAERRHFADPGFDEAAARRRQLEKAQQLYASIAS